MLLSLTIRRLGIALLVASSVFSPAVSRAEVSQRVVFARGKTSVSYTGKLPRKYADYDSYVLRAKKGQTLSVKLMSTDPDAYFAVYETQELGPDEDAILANDEKSREWSGQLPIKSEYSVQVYGVSTIDDDASGAAYTIEISLR